MRAAKNLFALLIVVVVLGGGAVVALRVARGLPSLPEEVKPDLVAARAAGMYLYAARVGGHVILFDAGGDPNGKPVDAALNALHAGRSDVSDVFITHAHGDHTAGAAVLPGARVHVGEADAAVAAGKAPPDRLLPRIMATLLSVPPISVGDPLKGVTIIDVGGGKTVKAIPLPGHTPGSYAFLYDGVLFVGDAMMYKQDRLDRGPSLFDSDSDAARAAILSLKRQLAGLDLDAVCTGHGGCTPRGLGRGLLDDLIARTGA